MSLPDIILLIIIPLPFILTFCLPKKYKQEIIFYEKAIPPMFKLQIKKFIIKGIGG